MRKWFCIYFFRLQDPSHLLFLIVMDTWLELISSEYFPPGALVLELIMPVIRQCHSLLRNAPLSHLPALHQHRPLGRPYWRRSILSRKRWWGSLAEAHRPGSPWENPSVSSPAGQVTFLCLSFLICRMISMNSPHMMWDLNYSTRVGYGRALQ